MKHLVLPTIKTFRLDNTTFEGKPIAEAMTAAAVAVADSRERVRKAAATLEAAEAGASLTRRGLRRPRLWMRL